MPLSEDEIRRIARHTIATAPVIQPPAGMAERAAHAPFRRISIHEAVRRRGANITATVRAIVDDEIARVMSEPERLAPELTAIATAPAAVSVASEPAGLYESWDPRWPPILKHGLKKAMAILERGLGE